MRRQPSLHLLQSFFPNETGLHECRVPLRFSPCVLLLSAILGEVGFRQFRLRLILDDRSFSPAQPELERDASIVGSNSPTNKMPLP